MEERRLEKRPEDDEEIKQTIPLQRAPKKAYEPCAKASGRKARVSIVRVYGYNKCLDGLEVGQASIATTVMVSNMSSARGWVLYSLGVRLCATVASVLC